jgi:hypothetical protein
MMNVLGIFQGKQKRYNMLTLQSLIGGAKTVSQIVEYIYLNTERKPKHNPKNVKRSIYSVIDRPSGAIRKLSEKQYIQRQGNLWQLTFKGFCVALTLFKDFDEVKRLIDFKVFDQALKETLVKLFDKHPLYALVKTDVVDDRVKRALERLEGDSEFGELLLFKLKEITESMLKQGVDLDDLSSEEFSGFVGNKLVPWFLERYVS